MTCHHVLTLAGGEAAGVGQSALVSPAPAGGGPVPRPRHAAASNLENIIRILVYRLPQQT